jgi:hypothetical protein
LRTLRLAFCTSAVVLALAVAPAEAAGKRRTSKNQGTGPLYGFGVGALLPEGGFDDFNDPGYFIQSRSLFAEKVFGGRASAYYGDTAGSLGADGGRVYGFDFDLLVKFGSPRTFGYVFAGVGYGTLTYTAADPTTGLDRRGRPDGQGEARVLSRGDLRVVSDEPRGHRVHPDRDRVPILTGCAGPDAWRYFASVST